jgi:hypothetical protein
VTADRGEDPFQAVVVRAGLPVKVHDLQAPCGG